jgi:nitrogenase molybdenum-iron protein alpha/beta subunit
MSETMNVMKALRCDQGVPRTSVSTQNACKLCAPLGASIVFRGIENCVPLVHGSQGCSTYSISRP